MKQEGKRLRLDTARRQGWRTRAVALTLAFAFLVPLGGFARADDEPVSGSGLCVHHPEHTEACGYIPPSEGSPCTHGHDESCGYTTGTEEVPCSMGCMETDESGSVIHSPSSFSVSRTDTSPSTLSVKQAPR